MRSMRSNAGTRAISAAAVTRPIILRERHFRDLRELQEQLIAAGVIAAEEIGRVAVARILERPVARLAALQRHVDALQLRVLARAAGRVRDGRRRPEELL